MKSSRIQPQESAAGTPFIDMGFNFNPSIDKHV